MRDYNKILISDFSLSDAWTCSFSKALVSGLRWSCGAWSISLNHPLHLVSMSSRLLINLHSSNNNRLNKLFVLFQFNHSHRLAEHIWIWHKHFRCEITFLPSNRLLNNIMWWVIDQSLQPPNQPVSPINIIPYNIKAKQNMRCRTLGSNLLFIYSIVSYRNRNMCYINER